MEYIPHITAPGLCEFRTESFMRSSEHGLIFVLAMALPVPGKEWECNQLGYRHLFVFRDTDITVDTISAERYGSKALLASPYVVVYRQHQMTEYKSRTPCSKHHLFLLQFMHWYNKVENNLATVYPCGVSHSFDRQKMFSARDYVRTTVRPDKTLPFVVNQYTDPIHVLVERKLDVVGRHSYASPYDISSYGCFAFDYTYDAKCVVHDYRFSNRPSTSRSMDIPAWQRRTFFFKSQRLVVTLHRDIDPELILQLGEEYLMPYFFVCESEEQIQQLIKVLAVTHPAKWVLMQEYIDNAVAPFRETMYADDVVTKQLLLDGFTRYTLDDQPSDIFQHFVKTI